MTLSRYFPQLHSAKFAPFAIIVLFLLTNFTGVLFGRALANSERDHLCCMRSVFQRVAGLPQQVGDVDGCQRIGTFHDQDVIPGQA